MLFSVQGNEPRQFHTVDDGIVTLTILNNSGGTIYLDKVYSNRIWEQGFPLQPGAQFGPVLWAGDLFIGINPDQIQRADFILFKSGKLIINVQTSDFQSTSDLGAF